jgi:hypothetical protein
MLLILFVVALLSLFCGNVDLPGADAFLLVSNKGEITLLGPLDIDPQMDDPKIRFMKGEGTTTVVQWSIGTQNLYTDWDSTMAQDLVFATAAGPLVAFTPDGKAMFNTTLSVLKMVEFGSTLSVNDQVTFGNELHVHYPTYLGNDLSVTGQVNFKYKLSVSDHASFGGCVTVLGRFDLGSSLSVAQFVRL